VQVALYKWVENSNAIDSKMEKFEGRMQKVELVTGVSQKLKFKTILLKKNDFSGWTLLICDARLQVSGLLFKNDWRRGMPAKLKEIEQRERFWLFQGSSACLRLQRFFFFSKFTCCNQIRARRAQIFLLENLFKLQFFRTVESDFGEFQR